MNSEKSFWDEAYRKNAPKLIGLCRRYVANKELAEDLVQETFITAINKQNTFRGKGSFEGWLRKIAVNTALMYLRKEKLFENNDLNNLNCEILQTDDINSETTKNQITNTDFEVKELLEAIDCLPVHHKLVFNMYTVENYSHKEIANILNIREGTSKSHLARARKKLQQILKEKADEKKITSRIGKSIFFILLSATAKANYIDKVFKKALSDYSVAPKDTSNNFLSDQNFSNQANMLLKKKSSLKSTTYALKILITIIISVIGIIFCTTMNIKTIEFSNKSLEITRPVSYHNLIKQKRLSTDSLPTKNEVKSTINNTKALRKKKPVIIKRTTIQKQTIQVHNTIQVNDSTNAN